MRLGFADAGSDAPGSSTRVAYDLLARGFGEGFNGPLLIAVSADRGADVSALTKLREAIAADAGVASVTDVQVVADDLRGVVSTFDVYPDSSPQSTATTQFVERLRQRVIPAALAESSLTAYVGGATATSVDFSHVMSSKMPLFVTLVVLSSCLLLMLLFRSLLIPVLTAAVNFLTVGAAFGALSAAYVWGLRNNGTAISAENDLADVGSLLLHVHSTLAAQPAPRISLRGSSSSPDRWTLAMSR